MGMVLLVPMVLGLAQEDRSLSGHKGKIVSLAFRPDGRRLASLGEDKTIRVGDVSSGKEIRNVPSTAEATPIAFDPKGVRLAVEEKRSLRILDPESGEERAKLKLKFGGVTGLAFTPDGSTIVAATVGDGVQFVDAATGKSVRSLPGVMTTASLSADGRILAYAMDLSEDVQLADAETLKEIRSFSGHECSVESVVLSADGKRLFSLDGQDSLRGWDATNGRPLFAIKCDSASDLALTADGTILAYQGLLDVRLIDAASGAEIRKIKADHPVCLGALAFSPDSKRLAAGLIDGTIQLIPVGK